MVKLVGLSFKLESYWIPIPVDGTAACFNCNAYPVGEIYALFIQATPPDVSRLSIYDAKTLLCGPCYEQSVKGMDEPGLS